MTNKELQDQLKKYPDSARIYYYEADEEQPDGIFFNKETNTIFIFS